MYLLHALDQGMAVGMAMSLLFKVTPEKVYFSGYSFFFFFSFCKVKTALLIAINILQLMYDPKHEENEKSLKLRYIR